MCDVSNVITVVDYQETKDVLEKRLREAKIFRQNKENEYRMEMVRMQQAETDLKAMLDLINNLKKEVMGVVE